MIFIQFPGLINSKLQAPNSKHDLPGFVPNGIITDGQGFGQ
jgi:hypothetical protein